MLSDLIESWIKSCAKKNGYAKVGEHFKEFFETINTATLRDYSPECGGMLRNPERGAETGQFATVSSEKLRDEEGLTRAMFNSRFLNLKPADVSGDNSREHKVIAFEAPLLRTPSRNVGNPRSVSCDLITMASNPFRLTTVEVKQATGGNTNLDYGLVEAWMYAQALARLVSDGEMSGGKSRYEHLWLEMHDCLRTYKFINNKSLASKANGCGIRYVVAAPQSYFKEQFETGAVDPEKMKEILKRLKSEGSSASSKPKFGGFWVLPCIGSRDSLIHPNLIFYPKGQQYVTVPTLNSNELVLCPDVDSLCRLVIACKPA